MFCLFSFIFVSCLGKLEDSLPSFKSVGSFGNDSRLPQPTQNQQTTTNHQTWPKSAIQCFSPWIYEHATLKSWNFGSGSDVFSFFNWGWFCWGFKRSIFSVAPIYHSLAPRGKRFFMQKTQGGWPRRICQRARDGNQEMTSTSRDIWMGFFIPKNPSRTQ